MTVQNEIDSPLPHASAPGATIPGGSAPGAAVTHAARRRTVWLGCAALALLTLIVYWPAITAGYIWDDPDYVLHNALLRSSGGLWRLWVHPNASPQYYPVVFTTFWLEFHAWRLDPVGYHLFNVLLHTAAALLIWRVMIRLHLPGGWLAAALFALHPVSVESVAWVTERKNVLSTVFYLLAFDIYLRNRGRRDYWTALALFAAALLSKSVTATLPAALLVVIWWRQGRLRGRDVSRLAPFFLLALMAGIFTAYLERFHVGANGEKIAELNFTSADRLLIAGRVVWFYAGKLLWPWPQAFIYPRWKIDPRAPLQWIFPLALAAALVLLWALRRRIGRTPLAIASLFVGTLFPVLGFVNVYPMRFSFVADHFQYLASIALFVPIAVTLRRFAGNYSVLILIPLAALSSRRAAVFTDSVTLWRDTLAKNPDSWMVNTNLANALVAQQRLEEAGPYFLGALELAPELFDTHANAGPVFGMHGDYERAIREEETAVALNPDFPEAYYNWGQILQNMGRTDEAIAKYGRALDLRPGYPRPAQKLAAIDIERGDPAAAIARLQSFLRVNPNAVEAGQDLAAILLKQKRFEDAANVLRPLTDVNPDDAVLWTNLGAATLQAGHIDEARAAFERALRIDPNYGPAERGLRLAELTP